MFWTYQLAQGFKRYDHFRLANWHQSYIIDIIISQSAAAIVTHCQRTEASVSHLHQTLWGRNADSGNFYYTIFQDPGPIEKFYTWNCSQFHTDYEIIIRSDGHLLYTQKPAVPTNQKLGSEAKWNSECMPILVKCGLNWPSESIQITSHQSADW